MTLEAAPSLIVNLHKILEGQKKLASFEGPGLTSKQNIRVDLYDAPAGKGIVFLLETEGGAVEVPATAASVVNTMRNVVLGQGKVRLCIVEHFLCATALWGLENIYVVVNGPEMPLADGSARLWIDLFERAGIPRKKVLSDIELPHIVEVGKGDRSILAIPAETFSVTYLMDWKHPKIGQIWKSWDQSRDISEVYEARTFGTLKEHQMLGLVDDVVSLTEDDFTMPLHSADEPVRHKLLDLIGDLALTGINPLRIKARFISIKGGHEMDVDIARKLSLVLANAVIPACATGV